MASPTTPNAELAPEDFDPRDGIERTGDLSGNVPPPGYDHANILTMPKPNLNWVNRYGPLKMSAPGRGSNVTASSTRYFQPSIA